MTLQQVIEQLDSCETGIDLLITLDNLTSSDLESILQ